MNIAIPTNDRKTVAEKSGKAKEFVIIEFNNNKIVYKSFLKNDHDHSHHNSSKNSSQVYNYNDGNPDHGHGDLVDLLDGVEIVIGKKFGPHFSKDFHTAGVKLLLTKKNLIEDAVRDANM